MKRRFAVLLLLFVIVSCFGCSDVGKESVMICGFSDSVPEISPNLEYSKWSGDYYVDKNQKKVVTVEIGEQSYTGTYMSSELVYGTDEIRHSYKDDKGKVFELNDNGVLMAYFWGTDRSSDKVIEQESCYEIACTLICNLYGFIIDDYQETITYDNNRDMYTFVFWKEIKNIETEDRITVVVESNGHIYSFRSSLCDRINELDVPDFDLISIEAEITKRLDELTKKARKKYDKVEYSDYKYSISIINGSKYAILCDADVNCINIRNDNEVLAERIQFLIPLC